MEEQELVQPLVLLVESQTTYCVASRTGTGSIQNYQAITQVVSIGLANYVMLSTSQICLHACSKRSTVLYRSSATRPTMRQVTTGNHQHLQPWKTQVRTRHNSAAYTYLFTPFSSATRTMSMTNGAVDVVYIYPLLVYLNSLIIASDPAR